MSKMLKISGSIIWRLGPRMTKRYTNTSASAIKTEKDKHVSGVEEEKSSHLLSGNKGLVAAAFASLNNPETVEMKPSPKSVKTSKVQQLDTQILKARDVNSLLMVAENTVVSRRHALKMVSVLSEWSSNNKVKLGDFEKDPRFLKLCRILARTPTSQAMSSLTMAEDLSTVLGITGDDEAARLISNLSLSQMVKVMKTLQSRGRRSTPLLRALSHNISRQSEVIDLKKSADLLFSMAALNFPDPILLDRICNDVIECLPLNDKPAVVNSIAVSLGVMRYRHEPALCALTAWLCGAHGHAPGPAHAQHVAAQLVTLATLNFTPPPPHGEQLLQSASLLEEVELSRPASWLDVVFALLVLERADSKRLLSVLQPDFVDKLLATGEIPIPSRRKLMAIDAFVSLTAGPPRPRPRLPDYVTEGVPLLYARDKLQFVHSIHDAFRSLVSADTFFKKDCDTNMGFLYDAEFAVDSRCHPVPLEKAANDKSVHRIAVLGLDYRDMSRRSPAPLGVYALYARLLRLKGFKVLEIPYTEYNPKDKLVTRVQYIEKRLKQIVKENQPHS